MRESKLAVVLCVALCLAGCGGGGGNSGANTASSTPTWAITSVSASCSPNTVQSSLTTNCSATVSGTGNYYSAVNWRATAGTISQAGAYTAPSVTADTQVTITAVAVYDPTKQGSTTITVKAPSTITFIQISCSPDAIRTGEQSQCVATVNGPIAEPQTVTWSGTTGFPAVDCQCISPSGVITGPVVAGQGQVNITATSTVDPTKSGHNTVYVLSPGTVTAVTPSCTKATLHPGEDTLCTAAVTGTGAYSSAVGWRATWGSILPSGLYLASKTQGDYTEAVTAYSVQDQSVVGTFTVTVTPSTTTANNVAPLVVDGGPTAITSPYVNGAFTSVTVCVPGTSNCQTIDHVLVDTGSVGLRLLAASAGGELNLPLPAYIDQSTGYNLSECAPFVSGFLWGQVVTADMLTLADGTGEQAPNIKMQVVGQTGQPAVPSTCSNSGTDLGTLQALGANGILGIGVFSEDCGLYCYGYWDTPYIYYACASGTCNATSAFDFVQVVNPVANFLSDSYASLIQLPTPTTSGPLQGSLIFGMNTQPNNQLGSATQLYADASGGFMTFYQNGSYSGSFIDSGSNGLFFLNSQTLGSQMPTCADKHGWYCPATTQSFSIVNRGTSGGVDGSGPPAPATFAIDNADQLFQNSGTYAIPTLGGNWPLSPLVFDFGLPFFYGRSIFTTVSWGGPPWAGSFAY